MVADDVESPILAKPTPQRGRSPVYVYATKQLNQMLLDNAVSVHNRNTSLNGLSDLSFAPNILVQKRAPTNSVSPNWA